MLAEEEGYHYSETLSLTKTKSQRIKSHYFLAVDTPNKMMMEQNSPQFS